MNFTGSHTQFKLRTRCGFYQSSSRVLKSSTQCESYSSQHQCEFCCPQRVSHLHNGKNPVLWRQETHNLHWYALTFPAKLVAVLWTCFLWKWRWEKPCASNFWPIQTKPWHENSCVTRCQGVFTPETIWNSSRIEQTNCHWNAFSFHLIRDEFQFISGVIGSLPAPYQWFQSVVTTLTKWRRMLPHWETIDISRFWMRKHHHPMSR